MSRNLLRVAAAVGVAASLAACSATPEASHPNGAAAPAQAGGSVPDACKVISKAELAAAAGVTLPHDGEKSGGNTCDYKEAGGIGGVLSIGLSATTKESFAKKMLAGRAVPGVGDQAVVGAGVLQVRHGTTLVTVIYISSGGLDVDTLPAEKKVAAKVIEKL